MDEQNHIKKIDVLQHQIHKISHWIDRTTEPFEDWDWDGNELTIYFNNECVEKYTLDDLREVIDDIDP